MKRVLLSLSLCVALLSACQGPSNCGRLIGSEQVIAVSPNPDSIFLYTPGIVEGFEGRFVVAVDYGGPGTYALDGPKSDFGDYKAGNQIRVLLSDDKGRTWRETPARIPVSYTHLTLPTTPYV